MVVVESFWELEDGQKIAWQAKYVFDIDGVIAEADKSYSNALKSHATMCKFVIAIPFDLPDPNYVKKASQLKVVDKKLPIEAESRDAGASDDSCVIYHYPVEGRDSTSGYASIFYIGKEKYENAEVGEKIRITQC